jgi:hypothetical protein
MGHFLNFTFTAHCLASILENFEKDQPDRQTAARVPAAFTGLMFHQPFVGIHSPPAIKTAICAFEQIAVCFHDREKNMVLFPP